MCGISPRCWRAPLSRPWAAPLPRRWPVRHLGAMDPGSRTAAGVDVAHQEVTVDEMIDLGRHFDLLRSEGRSSAPLSEEAAIIMTSGYRQTTAPRSWIWLQLPAAGGDVHRHGQLSPRHWSTGAMTTEETFTDTVNYLRAIGRLAR